MRVVNLRVCYRKWRPWILLSNTGFFFLLIWIPKMTLTFGDLISLSIHLVYRVSKTLYLSLKKFDKIHRLSIFPYKSIRNQNWHCNKLGQGQCRLSFDKTLYHQSPTAAYKVCKVIDLSVLEKIFKGFTIHLLGCHLGHVIKIIWTGLGTENGSTRSSFCNGSKHVVRYSVRDKIF